MLSDRTIWVCRHGERVDNIDPSWKRMRKRIRGAWDDPPLSERGMVQAQEVALRLKDEPIEIIVSSPFERCVHTAQIIASGHSRPLCINVEQGICEALSYCQSPPGWLSWKELKAKYPSVNEEYEHVFETLPDKERPEDCLPRIQETVIKLTNQYKGDILLVSHGCTIGATHRVLVDDYSYVGQCTLSKFVQLSDGRFQRHLNGDSSHLSDRTNLRGD